MSVEREKDEMGDEVAELTPEERDAVLGAAALAYTPDAGPMPAALRAKVEADARAHFGKRAKEHARARADERSAPTTSGASTTAAGAQVVVLADRVEARAARRTSPLVTWGGWAAAAAALVVLATRSRGGDTSPPLAPPASSVAGAEEQVLAAEGAEVRFDLHFGLGLVKVPEAAAARGPEELLELWVTFAGDTAPRLVATSANGRSVAFGPVCRPVAVGALRCAPIARAVVTRERTPGVAALREENVVVRLAAAPKP